MAVAKLINTRSYSAPFLDNKGNVDEKYVLAAPRKEVEKIAALGGIETKIDTPLEIALLSNCVGVVNIRPAEANQIPNNPKEADLILGAAVFQEIQILRFLGRTASLGQHEGRLKVIIDHGNVTREEIEEFYREGIGELVSEIVNENVARSHFGKPTEAAMNGIKDVITRFMLDTTFNNFYILDRLVSYYSGSDNERDKGAKDVLINSVSSFNAVLGEMLSEGKEKKNNIYIIPPDNKPHLQPSNWPLEFRF